MPPKGDRMSLPLLLESEVFKRRCYELDAGHSETLTHIFLCLSVLRGGAVKDGDAILPFAELLLESLELLFLLTRRCRLE